MPHDFGREVFHYLAELVPHWRVSDDAWILSDGSYLAGIGVLRNFGGDVMVVPYSNDDADQLEQLARLNDGDVTASAGRGRIVVVSDDREGASGDEVSQRLTNLHVICWSHRESLGTIVVKDASD